LGLLACEGAFEVKNPENNDFKNLNSVKKLKKTSVLFVNISFNFKLNYRIKCLSWHPKEGF
jgi:hypothetical protein